MSTRVIHCTINQLPGLVDKHLRGLQHRVGDNATFRTAQEGAAVVRERAPKAFGELRDSTEAYRSGSHGNGPSIAVDAPHAGAVEIGSAPHTPDLERLIAWVKLRGMQGLSRLRSAKLHGTTTRDQAVRVRDLLKNQVQSGPGGQFSPIDAPVEVARAIAKGIEQHGTRPHWFVRDSLPAIRDILARNVRKELGK